MDNRQLDCSYDQWVDSVTKFLKEQRHGSHLVVMIHSGPGQVEALYSTPDATIVLGMMDIARLSLEAQLKSSMRTQTEISHSPTFDKMKVN